MPSPSSTLQFVLVLALGVLSKVAYADEAPPPLPPPAAPPPPSVASPSSTPAADPDAAVPGAVPTAAAAASESPRGPAPRLILRPCADGSDGCVAESAQATRGRVWYGYQTLIADAAAVGIGFSSAALGAGGAIASAGTYLLAPPIIHIVHGNPAMFAASLATRVLSPALGGVTGFAIGAAVDGCSGGGDFVCGAPIGGALIGVVGGFLAASALDAALYSREPGSEQPTSERAAKGWDGKPRVTPNVSPSANGATVGVGGVF